MNAEPYTNGHATTLEHCLAEFTQAMQDEREKSWEAGHAICRAIAMSAAAAPPDVPAKQRKAMRRALIGQFASAGHCTLNRVVQLATVYADFCADGDRRVADKPWSWHRSVGNAARRAEATIVEVLVLAERNDWGQRELNAYGRTGPERVRFDGDCPECGGHQSFVFKKPGVRVLKGLNVACGFCAATVPGTQYLGMLVVA